MTRVFAFLLGIVMALPLSAQQADAPIQLLMQEYGDSLAKPSRKTVGVVLDDLVSSGLPQVPVFLEQWAEKNVWQNEDTGLFFIATKSGDALNLRDVDTGAETTGVAAEIDQLKPNGGARRGIGTALVQFQLGDPDRDRRATALESIARRPAASQLAPLVASLEGEDDSVLRARKEQLITFLSARFGETTAQRIAAIEALSEETSVEARAVLNQILSSKVGDIPHRCARCA